MGDEQLARVIEDADLVVNTAMVLGQLNQSSELVRHLAVVKGLPDGSEPSAQQMAELRIALSEAISRLAPITLGDLRDGWHPYRRTAWERWQLAWVGLGCLLLLISTGYMTLAYERVSAFFLTTKELQTSQSGELATKLYLLLKKNKADDIINIQNTQLYDEFIKQLMALHQLNKKISSYGAIDAEIRRDMWLFCVLQSYGCAYHNQSMGGSSESYPQYYDNLKKKYISESADKNGPAGGAGVVPSDSEEDEQEKKVRINVICSDQKNKDEFYCKINSQFREIRYLMYALNVGVDPRSQGNFLIDMYRQQAQVDFLGRWILPACYGMIGAMLLFMRRYLDSAIPDPSIWKLLYRIVLGGFAGVISVWFLTPASANLDAPTFASAGAFGIAFLVGFSTDLLFGTLDRLSKVMSDAVGK